MRSRLAAVVSLLMVVACGGPGNGGTGGGSGGSGGSSGGGTGGATGGGTGGATGGGTGGATGGGTGGATGGGAGGATGGGTGGATGGGTGGSGGGATGGGTGGGSVVVPSDAGAPASFWVLRVGEGAGVLTAASTSVFVEQHALDGGVMQVVNVPNALTGNNMPLTLTGNSTTEGGLTLSTNGAYVVLGGYGIDAGYSAAPGNSNSLVTPRVVGRIDVSNGTVDSTTRLFGAYMGGTIRGTASVDGTAFWTSGSGAGAGVNATDGGVQYSVLGGSYATRITTGGGTGAPDNLRHVGIYGGNLYFTSASGQFQGICQMGTGLPTTASTGTLLNGFPTAAGPFPTSFVGFDTDTAAGVDTFYLADNRTGAGFGVQKWTLGGGGAWTLAATFANGIDAGVLGVTGFRQGTTNTLITTTNEVMPRILRFDDDGVNNNPVPTPLYTAPANQAYRGIAVGR